MIWGKMDHRVLKKMSELARLDIDDEPLVRYAGQMEQIVSMFDQIAELDTRNIEPLSNVYDKTAPLVADTEVDTDLQERFLSSAPVVKIPFIKVPLVIDRSGK